MEKESNLNLLQYFALGVILFFAGTYFAEEIVYITPLLNDLYPDCAGLFLEPNGSFSCEHGPFLASGILGAIFTGVVLFSVKKILKFNVTRIALGALLFMVLSVLASLFWKEMLILNQDISTSDNPDRSFIIYSLLVIWVRLMFGLVFGLALKALATKNVGVVKKLGRGVGRVKPVKVAEKTKSTAKKSKSSASKKVTKAKAKTKAKTKAVSAKKPTPKKTTKKSSSKKSK